MLLAAHFGQRCKKSMLFLLIPKKMPNFVQNFNRDTLLSRDMEEQQNIIIYRTADGRASVALYARDGKIWLNQQQMAELFATSKPNISMHIANILKEKELSELSVVKNFLTTAADGKNSRGRVAN